MTLTELDTLHQEDLLNKSHPALFEEGDHYTILILRIPHILKDEVVLKSHGFVIADTLAFHINRETKTLIQLDQGLDSIHKIIDKEIDHLVHKFAHFQDTIGDIEDNLFESNRHADFNTAWLGLKRDILKIERVLMRSETILDEFNDYYRDATYFPSKKFLNSYEHINRVLRSAALQLSKLDYLYNFYNTQTNEKMNRLIYMLTIISAIFLPLNLAVGFFGMNTSALPFTGGNHGTLGAVILMGIILAVTLLLFSLMRRRNF